MIFKAATAIKGLRY